MDLDEVWRQSITQARDLYHSTPHGYLAKLRDEVGELTAEWYYLTTNSEAIHEPAAKQRLANEIADVFNVLAAFADEVGIRLPDAIEHKNKIISTRTYGPPDAEGKRQHL